MYYGVLCILEFAQSLTFINSVCNTMPKRIFIQFTIDLNYHILTELMLNTWIAFSDVRYLNKYQMPISAETLIRIHNQNVIHLQRSLYNRIVPLQVSSWKKVLCKNNLKPKLPFILPLLTINYIFIPFLPFRGF